MPCQDPCFRYSAASSVIAALAHFLDPRQRSEQNFTSFQLAAHLRRHANFKPHAGQIFVGKSAFFFIFGMSVGSCDRGREIQIHYGLIAITSGFRPSPCGRFFLFRMSLGKKISHPLQSVYVLAKRIHRDKQRDGDEHADR